MHSTLTYHPLPRLRAALTSPSDCRQRYKLTDSTIQQALLRVSIA